MQHLFQENRLEECKNDEIIRQSDGEGYWYKHGISYIDYLEKEQAIN